MNNQCVLTSARSRSYNDLLKLVEIQIEELRHGGDAAAPAAPEGIDTGSGSDRESVVVKETDDDDSDDDDDDDDDSSSSCSDFSTSDIPKSLLAALTNETFARRSSFMSKGTQPEVSRGNEVALNLEREKTKMESFDCYVLVSVLTATASFSTLQDFTPLEDLTPSLVEKVLMVITQIAAGLSTICGLYATVVFSLTVLYAKSAIGLNRDATYTYFLKETGMVRVRGFQAFSASLLTFALEAGLVTFLRLPNIARYPAVLVIAVLIRNLCNDWLLIVDTAKVIYTGNIPNKKEKGKT
jgi:hypothetical protein